MRPFRFLLQNQQKLTNTRNLIPTTSSTNTIKRNKNEAISNPQTELIFHVDDSSQESLFTIKALGGKPVPLKTPLKVFITLFHY